MTTNSLRAVLMSAGFDVVDSSESEVVIICPVKGCGDTKGKCSVNADTLKVHCWRCTNGGNLKKWAKRLGVEIDVAEESATLKEVDGLSQAIDDVTRVRPAYFTDIALPEDFKKLRDNRGSIEHKWIGRMATRKNLTVEDFEAVGAGYVETGSWEGYCIFPVEQYGNVCYYQGRTYNERAGEITKKFPSREVCPLSSKHWVYGIDEARVTKATNIIIVESILNVLSLRKELKRLGIEGVAPVAVFKHSISREQSLKLASLRHCKDFCLLYDPDATLVALRGVRAQSSIPIKLITVAEMPWEELPDGTKKGIDANDNARIGVKMWKNRISGGKTGLRSMELLLQEI